MPNQRDKDKRKIGGYYPSKDADAFKARADELGMTVSELLGVLIREELKRHAPKGDGDGK